jgi:hypothetical protein
MNEQHRPTITAVHTAKPKRRKPNQLLIDEAQADAAEFADKADYWMRVSAALTLVIIVGAFYAAIQLI